MKRGRPRKFDKDETFTAEVIMHTLEDEYLWLYPQVLDFINTMRRRQEDQDASVQAE